MIVQKVNLMTGQKIMNKVDITDIQYDSLMSAVKQNLKKNPNFPITYLTELELEKWEEAKQQKDDRIAELEAKLKEIESAQSEPEKKQRGRQKKEN